MKQINKKQLVAFLAVIIFCLTIFASEAQAQRLRFSKRHGGAQMQVMQTPHATIIRISHKGRGNTCRPRTCSKRNFRGNRRAMCR
jgi:hypothetical protein